MQKEMKTHSKWVEKDQKYVWHPYTQQFTAPAPVPIVRGEGAFLYTEDGKKILDAASSWWVTVHGHANPVVAEAIAEQARTLEQVIFAGFTHPQAVRLSERLVGHLPNPLNRVFFSDDGSTAVEVALKMAWQYFHNLGTPKTKLLALDGAYHGDTFGAMAVSGRSIFTKAFDPLLFEVVSLPSPGAGPLEKTLKALEEASEDGEAAALIVEPLVQGAGGMLMYSPEDLTRLVSRARELGLLVIFDEVMTGFYRTGKMFAMNHLEVVPDLVALSKGLTGGFLPMSVTVASDAIYEAFLSEDRTKTLFHGHSYTANPIACAAANASLDLFEREETQEKIARLCELQEAARERFSRHPNLKNVRRTGTVLAMDLETGEEGYLANVGQKVGPWFLERGILMRPLGNVLYIMPPYSTPPQALTELYGLLEEAIAEFLPS